MVRLIEEWLATTPHLRAVDILARLEEHVPSRFGKEQRRTLQRLVKNWRTNAARQLISSAEAVIRIDPPVAAPLPDNPGRTVQLAS